MKTSTAVFIGIIILILAFMLEFGSTDNSYQSYDNSDTSTVKKDSSSNSYCGFAKSEDGRRLSIGQDCPSGERCVETNCVFVTRTTDAGNTYACDGICK